jgi:hypothetical membrane protein
VRAATVSSALAPLALVGGFIAGAAAQPASYDSVHDTISALAARGASDRWIMTTAFVLLGACHLVTAYGLRRPVLALGGLASGLLALAPQPAHGSSTLHLVLAGIGLTALAIWPIQDGRRGRTAALVLTVLLIWFAITLQAGAVVGLVERLLTLAEALWPIAAVTAARRSRRTRSSGRRGAAPS